MPFPLSSSATSLGLTSRSSSMSLSPPKKSSVWLSSTSLRSKSSSSSSPSLESCRWSFNLSRAFRPFAACDGLPFVKTPFVLCFKPELAGAPFVAFFGMGTFSLISPEAFLFLPRTLSSIPALSRFKSVICDWSSGGGGPCFFMRRPTPMLCLSNVQNRG